MTPATVLTQLPRGPEHGTDIDTLAACLGLDERQVRQLLRDLALAHQPINTKGGVYFARNQAELQPTINDLWKRFIALRQRLDALALVVFEDGSQLQLPV